MLLGRVGIQRRLIMYAIIFVLLNLTDILVTYFILGRDLGIEGNSIMTGIMRLPMLSVIAIKVFGSMLAACIILLLPQRLEQHQQRILRVLVITMIAIVVFNTLTVIGGILVA